MANADVDDDSYVTIGTPFDIPDKNESLPKASRIEDQVVTDDRGRRRFHGAFTGGFSAGYFNTVGSKEGWSPSTFISSRSKNSGNEKGMKPSAKPEDYMDEEDFADHGIAPKKLKTIPSCDVLTESIFEKQKSSFQKVIDAGEVHSAIPGGVPLDYMYLIPSKLSIGMKLLNNMGWKPGQGIGEKVELPSEISNHAKTKKVYGCSLPPKSGMESMDMQSFTLLLAPKDIQPISFIHKDNLHGIGYSGIIPTKALFGTCNTISDEIFRPSSKEKKGIRGQAFGTGVFEDDDDCIYAEETLSSYDMTMGDDNADDLYGWSGAPKANVYKGCLPGFVKSLKKLDDLITPPTIQVPHDYVPRHIFAEDKQNKAITSKEGHNKLSSKDRSIILGEVTKSMDDVKKWTLKWDQSSSSTSENTSKVVQGEATPIEGKKSKYSRWDKDVDQVCPKQKSNDNNTIAKIDHKNIQSTENKRTGGFKPYIEQSEKQNRYEEFLSARNTSCKPDLKYNSMTEWEREQEISEFSRAAGLYQPLVSVMANRFTHANFDDVQENSFNIGKESDRDEPEDKKAAEMGMHGKLTQTVLNWHPDPVLCKRMNIPNPYPGSCIKGVPARGKKQSSFFLDTDNIKMVTPTNAVTKSDDFNEEDEIFTRMTKNRLKTINKSKGGIGPLSHLNIKIGSQKVEENSNNINTGISIINAIVEEVGTIRPPIDIFKAIFEDSSSDCGDTSDENVIGKKENTIGTASVSVKSELIAIQSEPVVSKFMNESICKRTDMTLVSTNKNNKNVLPLAFLNPEKSSIISNIDSKPPNYSKNQVSEPIEKTLKQSDMNNDCQTAVENEVGKTMYTMKFASQNNEIDKCTYSSTKYVYQCASSDPLQKDKQGDLTNIQIDTSKCDKHDKIRYKKKKKEKKIKKRKKKKYNSDNTDSDIDQNYKSKKSKKSKHRYSKKSSSSSSEEETLVPSNDILLEKLKQYKSSQRQTAADFM